MIPEDTMNDIAFHVKPEMTDLNDPGRGLWAEPWAESAHCTSPKDPALNVSKAAEQLRHDSVSPECQKVQSHFLTESTHEFTKDIDEPVRATMQCSLDSAQDISRAVAQLEGT